jgi:hypothetical protein
MTTLSAGPRQDVDQPTSTDAHPRGHALQNVLNAELIGEPYEPKDFINMG